MLRGCCLDRDELIIHRLAAWLCSNYSPYLEDVRATSARDSSLTISIHFYLPCNKYSIKVRHVPRVRICYIASDSRRKCDRGEADADCREWSVKNESKSTGVQPVVTHTINKARTHFELPPPQPRINLSFPAPRCNYSFNTMTRDEKDS